MKQSSSFRPSIRMWQGGSENVSHVHIWPATNLNVWFESVWETRQHTAGRRFIQVLVLSWLLRLSELFKTRSKSPFCLLSFLTGARDQRPDDRVARWCCAHTHTSQISSYCYMQAQNIHTDTCMRTKTQTDMGAGFKIKQRWVVSVCSTCLWNLCTAQSVPATAAPLPVFSHPPLILLLLGW